MPNQINKIKQIAKNIFLPSPITPSLIRANGRIEWIGQPFGVTQERKGVRYRFTSAEEYDIGFVWVEHLE